MWPFPATGRAGGDSYRGVVSQGTLGGIHYADIGNAAERALRPLALGRKSWLFAGFDRGGEPAAAMYTLIGTAKLNDVDPQAWLADVLGRIPALPHTRVHKLLPWNWKAARDQTPVA